MVLVEIPLKDLKVLLGIMDKDICSVWEEEDIRVYNKYTEFVKEVEKAMEEMA